MGVEGTCFGGCTSEGWIGASPPPSTAGESPEQAPSPTFPLLPSRHSTRAVIGSVELGERCCRDAASLLGSTPIWSWSSTFPTKQLTPAGWGGSLSHSAFCKVPWVRQGSCITVCTLYDTRHLWHSKNFILGPSNLRLTIPPLCTPFSSLCLVEHWGTNVDRYRPG